MKIDWNLRMLCAEKGIWSGAELGRALRRSIGLEMTPQALINLLTSKPKNLSLNMLLALCVTLECTPNDLLVVDTRHSFRTARDLLDAITKVNQAKAPKAVRGGRRKRTPAAPPKTRI